MALRSKDADFENFCTQAKSLMGNDLDDDWLLEMWSGADGDLNRALNHVLDSPEDKVKRSGGGHKSSSAAAPPPPQPPAPKTPKKKKHHKPSPPPAPAADWDDEYDDPFFQTPVPAAPPAPAPQAAAAPPPPPPPPPQQQQQQQPPATAPAVQQQGYQQPGYPPQMMPSQPGMYYNGPQQPMNTMPNMAMPPQTMPGMMPTQPVGMGPPGTMPPQQLPMGPMNPQGLQTQQQMMFIQNQQQQLLVNLKYQLDTVLANPAMLQNPMLMQQLYDTMSAAMEAPATTLQLSEKARQNEQTAQFIQMMQAQISQMLGNPQVAANPQLLQHLNTQMNQLRLITMQHVASQNLLANPATSLALSSSLLDKSLGFSSTPDLKSALAELSDSDEDDDDEESDGEWWKGKSAPSKKSKKAGSTPDLSATNPFNEPEGEDEVDDEIATKKKDRRKGKKRTASAKRINKLIRKIGLRQAPVVAPSASQSSAMMMMPPQTTPMGGYYPGYGQQQGFPTVPNMMYPRTTGYMI
ncbi:Alpha/beta-gliadin A-V precursor, putative [Perkinsus marinus ATCC 50983]|uniref:Alpha/beta-gliadin A-V, putative n=1 Tax=Perkinsus marinus (strain ATCC 50983 / TXsc) TaxID=423536 RepID=C5KEF2_PERM5|nr:Alpha/beta-gliadin A-V precursor, putative [Perkinsus marinus ATCC 50983]EER17090.1 Alpha/beta-gliadin A-V precursor, putative [Perkinsus marinus ATCC 50983]|eukprot:XP_002785294.1 Alpha/beta-gliadin A-V precursor, putative [Perkinsus marinus ATCC 50983]